MKKAIKISVIIAVVCIVLALIGYFVAYPFIAVKTGDYHVYIDMYNVKEYAVPDGVTYINFRAFYSCDGLASVTMPDSVTSISHEAFYYCTDLTSVTLSSSITSIEHGTFYSCKSLASVTIPDGVTSIDFDAFNGCSELTSVTIPNSVTKIGSRAFSWCFKLTNITFNGTKAQWNAIHKEADWNEGCDNLTVYCTDGNITK